MAGRYRPATAGAGALALCQPKLGTFIASENAADQADKIKAVVERTYALSEVAMAIRDLIDGRARGKIVITM